MNSLTLKAPAKINLGLNIISKREDGFHNLETIFYPIEDLYDILIFEESDKFSLISEELFNISEENNLVTKAKLILEKFTGRNLPVKITLKKNIPVGGGLGGGSSDAAKALLGLNEFFDLNIPKRDFYKIALQLGSDVPFFLLSRPAFAESRGEVLLTLNFKINFPILLVNPGIHISTKEAFQNIKPKEEHIDYLQISSLQEKELVKFNSLLKNDFEPYVFKRYPEVEKIKNELLTLGAFFALMSGTGSTVYGIFEDMETAEVAQQKFTRNYFTFLQNPQ